MCRRCLLDPPDVTKPRRDVLLGIYKVNTANGAVVSYLSLDFWCLFILVCHRKVLLALGLWRHSEVTVHLYMDSLSLPPLS